MNKNTLLDIFKSIAPPEYANNITKYSVVDSHTLKIQMKNGAEFIFTWYGPGKWQVERRK